MILEQAVLDVKPGQEPAFEAAFAKAQAIISASPGYVSHELQRCVEKPNRYLLLVRWQTLEDHTEGFRGSAPYQEWKALLHHFYDPFPSVEHYRPVESPAAPQADEERFRLVTGFNDIFVVIASLLLIAAVRWIGDTAADWVGALLAAATAWLLAELFVRRRRMALPAIVLLLAFVAGIFFTVIGLAAKQYVLASGLAAVAAWLHWRRFHVPITVAAGVGAAVASVTTLIISHDPRHWAQVIFFAGAVVLALAMRYDASDRLRQTRRSDIAFWLHLLAAPLLVHPVVVGALDLFDSEIAMWKAVFMLALYVAIAFVSLCIDRRALMVSALGYVLYTFAALLKATGMVDLNFAVTALVVGVALLLLSAYWQASRRYALRFVPAGLAGKLPPLR